MGRTAMGKLSSMAGELWVVLVTGAFILEQPARQIRITARMTTGLLEKLVENIIYGQFGNIVHGMTAAAKKAIFHTDAAFGGGTRPDNLF